MQPGVQDARFNALEQRVRTDNAAQLNNSRNRLQDLGFASQGASGIDPLSSIERGSGRDLQSSLLALDEFRAQEDRSNLQAAQGGLGTSTDIFRALNLDPRTAQALNLATSQNAQLDPFANQLERNAQIAAGTALANRNADPLALLGTIGGGLIGGIGQAGGLRNFLGLR